MRLSMRSLRKAQTGRLGTQKLNFTARNDLNLSLLFEIKAGGQPKISERPIRFGCVQLLVG